MKVLRVPYPVFVSDESGTCSTARLKCFLPFNFFFLILCQGARNKGETLKLMATKFERNNRK